MLESEKKYRHELKYVISIAQMTLLKNRIMHLMRLDPNVGTDGIYNIRSVYFDDYTNRYYYENENGTDPREKFRIRIYNHSSARIMLECKHKERGKTRKDSCLLTREQADQLLCGKQLFQTENVPPLLRKLMLEMQMHHLRPVVIVEYNRIPYVYRNGNVRVTFDTQIASSPNINDFFAPSLPRRPILPVGQCLMEVKYDEYLPDFIYRSLNMNVLQRNTFSKYYLCRKYSLH